MYRNPRWCDSARCLVQWVRRDGTIEFADAMSEVRMSIDARWFAPSHPLRRRSAPKARTTRSYCLLREFGGSPWRTSDDSASTKRSIEFHRSFLEAPLAFVTSRWADTFEPDVLKIIVWHFSFHIDHLDLRSYQPHWWYMWTSLNLPESWPHTRLDQHRIVAGEWFPKSMYRNPRWCDSARCLVQWVPRDGTIEFADAMFEVRMSIDARWSALSHPPRRRPAPKARTTRSYCLLREVVRSLWRTSGDSASTKRSIEFRRSFLEAPLAFVTSRWVDTFEPDVLKTIVWYFSFYLHHVDLEILPATLMVHVVVAEPAGVVATHQTWPASDSRRWMISKVDVS